MSDNPPVTTFTSVDVVADTTAFIQSETARITTAQQQMSSTASTLDAQIAALTAQRAAAQKVIDMLATDLTQIQTLQNDIAALVPAPVAPPAEIPATT